MVTTTQIPSKGRVAIDIESYDPGLKARGPGFVYRDGRSFVVGVSLAWLEGQEMQSLYLPWRHSEGNVDIETSKSLLASLDLPEIELVGANIHYDLEGLRSDGLMFRCAQKRDVQIAEFLIDDATSSYSLASLANKYLGKSKSMDELQTSANRLLGVGKDAYLNMHNLPSAVVSPYARRDAELTIDIYEKQIPVLQVEGLMEVFLLECGLIDYVQDVRWRGIRIDVERAFDVCSELKEGCDKHLKILETLSGNRSFNIWAQRDIEKAAVELALPFPKTLKDNASFPAAWLSGQVAMFWKSLHQARLLDRGGAVFVKSKILDLQHNGRLYYQLSQVRGENGGTVSSRFASRNPNMQQIPARNSELAQKIRSLFLPEEGETWVSIDESQAEIRATVHYASLLGLPGAEDVVSQYVTNPDTDYHQWVANLTGISRREAKTITFAILYGAGVSKIASELGVEKDRAKEILSLYRAKLSFAQPLAERCRGVAVGRGYIKTILGRKRRFDLFGPAQFTTGVKPKKHSLAIKEFGPYVSRYFVHKALNALIQGSCADIHKLSLLNLYQQKTPLCLLPIHDEMNFSVPTESLNKDILKIRDTILNSHQLKVPRQVTIKCGNNFGNLMEY